MPDRPSIEVQSPPGGWPAPWPNVAELEEVLPCEHWTLVGGLMTQVHAIHRSIESVRPTNDIDIILHVETEGGTERPARTAAALESLGYRLRPGFDPRNQEAHRFVRDGQTIDLVASDIVDVVIADHAAPRVLRSLSLKGKTMVQVEGGTQALRRTVTARLDIVPGRLPGPGTPPLRCRGPARLRRRSLRGAREPRRQRQTAPPLVAARARRPGPHRLAEPSFRRAPRRDGRARHPV